MRVLGDFTSSLIHVSCLFVLHSGQVLLHHRTFHHAFYPPRSLSISTTLLTELASATVLRPRFEHILYRTVFPLLLDSYQPMARWTDQLASPTWPLKLRAPKFLVYPVHLARARLSRRIVLPRCDNLHLLSAALLNVVPRHISVIRHNPLRQLPRGLFNPLQCRCQLMHVVGLSTKPDRHHCLHLAFRAHLHVVARCPASIGMLHLARFWFGITHPYGCLFLRRSLGFQLLQLLHGCFRSLQFFPRCSHLRRLSFLIHCLAHLSCPPIQFPHYLACLLQPVFQRFAPVKRTPPRHRLHLRSVVQDRLQIDLSGTFQHGQKLGKQLLQRLFIPHSEIRKRVIVDRLVTG